MPTPAAGARQCRAPRRRTPWPPRMRGHRGQGSAAQRGAMPRPGPATAPLALFACHYCVGDCAAADAIGQGSDRIEVVDSGVAPARVIRRCVGFRPARPHRAAGVGNDRHDGAAVGDQNRSPRRGTAGDASAVTRIAWRAVRRRPRRRRTRSCWCGRSGRHRRRPGERRSARHVAPAALWEPASIARRRRRRDPDRNRQSGERARRHNQVVLGNGGGAATAATLPTFRTIPDVGEGPSNV